MFWSRKQNQIVLAVRVSPNAKRAGAEGIWNGTHLKIALTAPPVEGKANEALIDFLSKTAGLRKSAVALISGQSHRQKVVALNFDSADTADSFESWAGSIR